MELANGEENGMKYRVYLNSENEEWVAEVIKEGKTIERRWNWYCAPIFGPDISDIDKAEKNLEELLSQIDKDKND